MSDRRRYMRRAVQTIIKSETSAWGGKRHYTLALICGHIVLTKNNARQYPPETARCLECTKAAGR